MSTTAIVLSGTPGEGLRIAGLTVLDRLLVVLHRGGCDDIVLVTGGSHPVVRRSRALGISVRVVGSREEAPAAGLVTPGNVTATANDVRELIRTRGRLVSTHGVELPISWRGETLGGPSKEAPLPRVEASPIARVVDGPRAAREAERALWASLSSSSDGIVDRYVNRPLSRPLARLLARTRVTPNQVTFVATVVGLAAAWRFTAATHSAMIEGALLFQLSAAIDCIDGDLARATFQESSFGKWFDIGADQAVHVAIFLALAIACARTGSLPGWWPWILGTSAAIGTALGFGLISALQSRRSRISPIRRPRGDTFDRFVGASANRDFSVVLIAAAVLGIVQWFLIATAIGVHVFWIAVLIAHARDLRSMRSEVATRSGRT